MLFRRDVENEGSWWVDEGLDNKVTRFEPCDLCNATMEARQADNRMWQEFDLCGECTPRLQILSAIAGIQDERPVNLDRELEIIADEHEPLSWL